MKTTIAEILGMALFVGGAYAQGTVNFVNLNAAAGVNAPVYLPDYTTKLTGPAWMAGLSAGTTSTSLAYIGNATPFLTGAGAGYFNGGTTTLAGFLPAGPLPGFRWLRGIPLLGGPPSARRGLRQLQTTQPGAAAFGACRPYFQLC